MLPSSIQARVVEIGSSCTCLPPFSLSRHLNTRNSFLFTLLPPRLRNRARAALVALANARLRAEAQALGRRALALRQLYAAASAGWNAAGLDMQTLASLIA